jgi:hypothetical protein
MRKVTEIKRLLTTMFTVLVLTTSHADDKKIGNVQALEEAQTTLATSGLDIYDQACGTQEVHLLPDTRQEDEQGAFLVRLDGRPIPRNGTGSCGVQKRSYNEDGTG